MSSASSAARRRELLIAAQILLIVAIVATIAVFNIPAGRPRKSQARTAPAAVVGTTTANNHFAEPTQGTAR